MKQIVHDSEFAFNIYSNHKKPNVHRNQNLCNEDNAVTGDGKRCLPSTDTPFVSVLFSYVSVASKTGDLRLISILSCFIGTYSGFSEFVTTWPEQKYLLFSWHQPGS